MHTLPAGEDNCVTRRERNWIQWCQPPSLATFPIIIRHYRRGHACHTCRMNKVNEHRGDVRKIRSFRLFQCSPPPPHTSCAFTSVGWSQWRCEIVGGYYQRLGSLNYWLAYQGMINIGSSLDNDGVYVCVAGSGSAGCGYPGAPAHSSVRFTGTGAQDVIDEEDALLKDTIFREGTVATYSCERGFELLGPARRQCQADGSWTPEGVPFCGEFEYFLFAWEMLIVEVIICVKNYWFQMRHS